MALAFLTACHNSIVTLLMGMPFERAQKYHRVLGALGWLNGVFHTYTAFFYHTPSGNEPIPLSSDTLLDTKEGLGDTEEAQRALLSEDGDLTEYDHNNFALIGENGGHPVKINGYSNFGTFLVYDTINASGTGIIFLMLAMILTALPPVRRVCFEFFYYLHILFAMAITGCAFYHSGLFVVLLVSFLWGGDMVMRKVIMALCRYPRKANISYLTDTVVELSFPKTKGFAYNPSQYAFIAVPEISLFQWHPFTISSSPHEDTVRFHIRKRGRWTKALHKLTDSRHQVTLLIEGPFGCLSTNMFDNRYKMIMLLSGGIGVTPMQSICHQLMHEHEAGSRELKKLWFFWTARDPEIIDNMDVTVKNSVRYLMDIDDVDDIAEGVAPQSLEGGRGLPKNKSHGHLVDKALMNVTPSQITDKEIEAMFPLEEIEEDDDQASQASQGPPIVNEDAKGADVERAYNPLPHSATMQNVLQEDAAAPTMHRGLSTPEFAGAAAEGKDGSNGSERNLAQGLSRTEHTRGMGPPYSSVRFQVETETIGHSQREVRDDPSPKSRPGLSFYTQPGGRGGHPGMPSKSKSWKPKEDTAADVLQLDFFLTAKEIKKQGAGEAVKDMPFVTQGRPQLKAIFARMREEAIRGGERRVAICLCAPKRLEDICRRACAKFSDGIVRFDFHSEVFD
uniref:FAD-binding FR-type domain-containing protein n=1 Tax=Trieres chinensis TaxID=1514140 RepID=A0A7S1ZTX8_TRICV